MRLFWYVNKQFSILMIYHFQSKGSGLNPENVTLVLEEASRRLGDEAEDKDLKGTAEKKSFKQTVKVERIISAFLLQAHLVKNSIRVASRSSKVTTTETCGDPAKYFETNNSKNKIHIFFLSQEKRLQRESSKDPEHFDGILSSFDGCQ